MGRMLDSLKHGDWPRGAQKPAPKLEPSVPANPEPVEEEFPFIEVGGPGKQVVASPTVMAVKLPQNSPPPPVPVAKPAAALAPGLGESQPLEIAFQAWPPPKPTGPRIAPELVVFHQPDHPVSLGYGRLFERLTQDALGGEGRVLLITGVAPRVGCTTVLLNLALWGARPGKYRLAVADVHLHHPTCAGRLGLASSPGLNELLAGKVALEAALQAGPVSGLSVLPAQPVLERVPTGLTPEAIHWLLACLRERFDLVLLDGPPLNSPELALLAPACDSLYLVLPQAEATQLQAGRLTQQVTRLGGHLRGLIHTQFAA